MAARLCVLGLSPNTVALVFNTLKSLQVDSELIILENLPAADPTPYDCGLAHRRMPFEQYTWQAEDRFVFGVAGARAKATVLDFFTARFPITRGQFINLIHPSALVAHAHQMDTGVFLEPGSIVSPFAGLGFGVSVFRGASIGHHTQIGDFCHISPGVCIGGKTRIGRGTTLGIGAVVFDHLSVGSDCMIGAGSLVNTDIPDSVVAYGHPCKVIRPNRATD